MIPERSFLATWPLHNSVVTITYVDVGIYLYDNCSQFTHRGYVLPATILLTGETGDRASIMHPRHVQQHLRLNGASKPGRRLRVLICACTSQEASEAFRFFDEAETVHIPTDDVSEVGDELSEVRPDFVLCKTDFLLRLMPFAEDGGRSHRLEPGSGKPAEKANALLKSSDVSSRDLEVLQLLAKGARNLDIAQALKLAESTVKRILQRLYERFEAANRAELLGRAMELHLFPESASNASSSKSR